MCKTLRECRDDVLRLSMEDKRQVGKVLMGRCKATSITLPGKGVNKYGEVGQKVVDGEWPVLKVLVPAAPGSSAKHGAAAEETESEEDGGEETVKVKTGDTGVMTAVLAILNDMSFRMRDLEKRQSKLEWQDCTPKQ